MKDFAFAQVKFKGSHGSLFLCLETGGTGGDASLGNITIPETIAGPLQHKNKFGKDYEKTGPKYEPK